jgi:putative aldouronate transport system substrate-binding protein
VPFDKGGGTVSYIRQDWLDELGLEVPTNYDEFINVLRAFKTLGDDVVPFTAPGFVSDQAEYYLREFYQDASPEFVKNADGVWVDGMTEDNMVDALQRMRDAYAEGLIDLEIVTNKTSTCRDKWYAGNVGVFTYWAGNWAVSLESRVQQSIPTAKVTAMNAIAEAHYIERVPPVFSISSTCKNPEAVFKYFVEYALDKEEGSTLFQHGVEGLHFSYDETGAVTALSKPSKPDEPLEKAFVSPILAISPIETEGYAFEVDERITTSLGILEADSVKAEIVPQSKKLSKINADLLAEKEKTVASIVMGQVSVEEGLANYKVKVENLGIAEVIAELNATN